uniref:N-acetyllactosaminide beta-1,3-N-acetylglucosaminyltransferase n=1 Tax=Rhabditophanes sp. KR3021 TaxID=114890 RepID=A0AC35TR61_9BILA
MDFFHAEPDLTNFTEIERLKFVDYDDNYCVLYDFWNSTTSTDRITLVLHSSISFFHHLVYQIKYWSGPISIAVPLPRPTKISCHKYNFLNNPNGCGSFNGIDMEIFNYFESFRTHHDISKISMHFLYEKGIDGKCYDLLKPKLKADTNIIIEMKNYKDVTYFESLYPINVARNIARIGKKTNLFLSGDVENYTSENFEAKLRKAGAELIINSTKNVVLVHRRFETADDIEIPHTKQQLHKLFKSNKVQVFHESFYKEGHYIPGLDEWFNVRENHTETSVFRTMKYNESPNWEPQFVGDSNVPLYDERFAYRSKSATHLSHILCYQDYTFYIMNDVFTVHKGIKLKYKPEEQIIASRLNGVRKNMIRDMFKSFNDDLGRKYPKLKEFCKPLTPQL